MTNIGRSLLTLFNGLFTEQDDMIACLFHRDHEFHHFGAGCIYNFNENFNGARGHCFGSIAFGGTHITIH